MNRYRILFVFFCLFLVAGIAFLAFCIHSRNTLNEYLFQTEAILASAQVANGGETTADPEKAILSDYEGKRYVIAPENYRALLSYLRKGAGAALHVPIDPENTLKLTVCGEAIFEIAPEKGNVDVVLIRLTSRGKTFQIRTTGGNQWTSLLACCTKGTYRGENLLLEQDSASP